MNKIIITKELTHSQKIQVCELVYQGFYKKLSNYWIFEKNIERGSTVLQDCINYNNGIYAIENGNVVGFIGIQFRKNKFREFNISTLKSHYGLIGATWRGLLNKFENKSNSLKEDEMYIDLIVVDSKHRGKGIASLLIEEVTNLSIENNFNKILLDVVDTNEGAINLYKKLGYKTIKVMDFKGLTDFMGYRKVMYMCKNLKN